MDNKKDHNIDELMEEISARRSETVQNFKVEFSVDDIPDVEVNREPEIGPVDEVVPTTADEDESEPVPIKKKKGKTEQQPRSKVEGCLLKIIYGLLICGIAGILASMVLIFVLDSMAFNRGQKVVDFEIPSGSSTSEIADMLQEKGLIDNAFCFRVYSKISGADGKWQVGAFTLSPDMGYATLVETLQTMTPRETVTVTIPEGYTVEEMAKLFEKKNVCTADDFYNAVVSGDYDYDFVKAIPTAADGKEHKGRIYRLEGYLFPDTYNFYVGSSGETVVQRMLENFDSKLTTDIRKQIDERGWTIDQTIIMASLIEGEAASDEDMEKVSRILANRLKPDSGYPKLQLCSTRDYVKGLLPTIPGLPVTSVAYNTYEREGMPVGAINNPGIRAIKAALNPSDDAKIAKCYFFATDYDTGITYYSETFDEHNYIIRKYGITDLG